MGAVVLSGGLNNTKMSDISCRIVVANVNGHNSEIKRKGFLDHLKKLNPTIIATIDSRISPNTERKIRNNTAEYNCFFSSFSSQSRGISIYVDKASTMKISKLYSDREGNALDLKIKDNDHTFVLCCIYGPTRDDQGIKYYCPFS